MIRSRVIKEVSFTHFLRSRWRVYPLPLPRNHHAIHVSVYIRIVESFWHWSELWLNPLRNSLSNLRTAVSIPTRFRADLIRALSSLACTRTLRGFVSRASGKETEKESLKTLCDGWRPKERFFFSETGSPLPLCPWIKDSAEFENSDSEKKWYLIKYGSYFSAKYFWRIILEW